jgi:thiosulfate dehydrogenase (quinone) large subunit
MVAMRAAPPDLDRRLSYAILRIGLGIDIFLHGGGRLASGLGGFIEASARQFATTPLPMPLVRACLAIIPPAELIIGALLIAGWRTRWALVAGAVLMMVLMIGTAVRSDWTTLALQLFYVLLYSLLLRHRADNWLALDSHP